MSIVHGKKLMCFVKDGSSYVSIGYATNHTLSTSASTIDVSHKDLADVTSGGKWDDQEIDTLSWTVTSENFYSVDAEGQNFSDLFALYAAGTTVDLKFGIAADSSTGVTTGGWTPQTTGQYFSGKAVITSLDLNASVSERASFSVTFQGKGPLTLA